VIVLIHHSIFRFIIFCFLYLITIIIYLLIFIVSIILLILIIILLVIIIVEAYLHCIGSVYKDLETSLAIGTGIVFYSIIISIIIAFCIGLIKGIKLVLTKKFFSKKKVYNK